MNLAIVGLGVMGRNLALNFRDAGHRVIVWDPWPDARGWRAEGIEACAELGDLIGLLPMPRIVLLMVKAGAPVSDLARQLADRLEPGDVIVDGGNSHFADTERDAGLVADRGIRFAGLGVSGGAEGARSGPSMMLGCSEETRAIVEPLLASVAAQHDGKPCLGWFGTGGAGHFVKMVHNGIEYAVMESIAESWQLLQMTGMDPASAGRELGAWAKGELAGYLMEISAEVLQTRDPASGEPLVSVVDDAAGQKGTGRWCVAAALELGVPVPSIAAALTLRQISSHPGLRQDAGRNPLPPASGLAADDVQAALCTGTALALMQGAHLLSAANDAFGWNIALAEAARVWRAGSILRMALLDRFCERSELFAFADRHRDGLCRSLAAAAMAGVPVPAMSSGLAYFDACRASLLPTALVQLQRDRFGAHGLTHKTTGASFHGPWQDEER